MEGPGLRPGPSFSPSPRSPNGRVEDAVTFQAYLDNIEAKTGKTPADLKALAEEDGVYAPDMKAEQLVVWLNHRFDLGRGHAMAIWAVFKSKGWVTPAASKK